MAYSGCPQRKWKAWGKTEDAALKTVEAVHKNVLQQADLPVKSFSSITLYHQQCTLLSWKCQSDTGSNRAGITRRLRQW